MSLLTNLISYWRLDETAGVRADCHGVNHLTDNNTVASGAGKIGNAAIFLAANSEYLGFPGDVLDHERTQAWTHSVWLKPNVLRSGGGVEYTIYSKFDGSVVGTTIYLNWDGTKTIAGIYIISTYPTNMITRMTTTDIPNGSLVHLVVTYDGSSTVAGVKFYLNASEQSYTGDADSLSASILNNTTPSFGRRPGGSLFFSGDMDEYGIWARVLTANERAELYNGGSGLAYEHFARRHYQRHQAA